MAARETLTGISAMFSPDEIECLVRTVGDAVCGDIDDLSSTQVELAEKANNLIHAEDHDLDAEAPTRADQRLLALAEELAVESEDLDDIVHDLASKPASAINNGGLVEQIPYLLDQLGEAETEQVIRDSAKSQRVDRR